MYKNLVRILNEKSITLKAYAEFLGVTEKTIQNKIQGKTEFTFGEVKKTCSIICPEYKMDFVFAQEEAAA
jgi:predicted transcriptional regulator